MHFAVVSIPLGYLTLAFIPVLVVLILLFKWTNDGKSAVYAVCRMVLQLFLVGYVLQYLFDSNAPWLVMTVLSMMLFVSSWIGIRHLREKNVKAYSRAVFSVAIGSIPTLLLVVLGVMRSETLIDARLIVPLAGMVFPPSMNVISLLSERLQAERERGVPFIEARSVALRASLIPVTNSLLAVGLVSLPGMMTGQVLAGVDPMAAVRYQIMVMCMIFGASGICAATYLTMSENDSGLPNQGQGQEAR
ncbi:MAG: putative ABC transport system permease protein [Planctomycetota bacterium]|jgi:putative ABC transport system permease protein